MSAQLDVAPSRMKFLFLLFRHSIVTTASSVPDSIRRWVKGARDERHNGHRAYILKCSSCGLRARGSEMPHKALVPANGSPVCNGVSIAALDELPKGVFCYCGANHPLSICWLLFPLC